MHDVVQLSWCLAAVSAFGCALLKAVQQPSETTARFKATSFIPVYGTMLYNLLCLLSGHDRNGVVKQSCWQCLSDISSWLIAIAW